MTVEVDCLGTPLTRVIEHRMRLAGDAPVRMRDSWPSIPQADQTKGQFGQQQARHRAHDEKRTPACPPSPWESRLRLVYHISIHDCQCVLDELIIERAGTVAQRFRSRWPSTRSLPRWDTYPRAKPSIVGRRRLPKKASRRTYAGNPASSQSFLHQPRNRATLMRRNGGQASFASVKVLAPHR